MKKTLLICLCCFYMFTCLSPVSARFKSDTNRGCSIGDWFFPEQQNWGSSCVKKQDKNDDLLAPPSNWAVIQKEDKLFTGHPPVIMHDQVHSIAGPMTVSIHPVGNMDLVLKGERFELIASVTRTADPGGQDVNISDDVDVDYEWYYIEDDGTETLIESSFSPLVDVDGKTLIMGEGPRLTSNKPATSPNFSILDHIPTLGDLVSKVDPFVNKNIYAGVSKEDLSKAFSKLSKIQNYTAKEYSLPIGVRVTVGSETVTAPLFTRPAFEKPAVPTYSSVIASPISCCEEEIITLTNTSPNDPDVIYMWVWTPSSNTPAPVVYPFATADLAQFLTQGNFSLPMKKPGYTGNYTLMAFKGSPVFFNVAASPTDIIVHRGPMDKGNTQLKSSRTDKKNKIKDTYCEGDNITIEGDNDGTNLDAGLDIGYQWYHNDLLIESSPGTAYTQESYSIPNATPNMSGTYKRVATTNASDPTRGQCSVTATISVTVNPTLAQPGAIQVVGAPVCEGDDLALSVTAVAGATQYRWTYADMAIGGRPGVERSTETKSPMFIRRSVTKNMAVTYTVQALDDNGCESAKSPGTKVDLVDKTNNPDCVKVHINPVQNVALVCKGDKFVLLASTSTISMTDAERNAIENNENGKAAEYTWFYVRDNGNEDPITTDLGKGIVVEGSLLIMNKGPEVTTKLPAEATAFSIADNIPGLADILNGAKASGSAIGNLPDINTILNLIPADLKKEFTDAAAKKMKDYLPKDLDKYGPKEYTMPIIAKLIDQSSGRINNATPFTRPIFERPQAPRYSITPTACCPGEVITFNSDDNQSDPAKPEVMYMWVGLPGSSINPVAEEFGLGSAFVPNLNKMFVKGPVFITMDKPLLYTGNYALSAFRGAPSPVGCSSIGTPTPIIVYGVPISDRNVKLKTGNNKLTYCEGDKITIKSYDNTDATTDGIRFSSISYEWYDKDNNLITSGGNYEFEPKGIVYPRTGEYLVIKRATAALAGTYTRYAITNRGCKAAVSITINVTPKPAPPADFTSNAPICEGDDLVLSVSPVVGATQYIWTYPDNGRFSNAPVTKKTADPTITLKGLTRDKNNGIYEVQADVSGCVSDAATITVDIHKQFDANTVHMASNSPVLEGMSLSLSATLVPGGTYAWKGPQGFTSNEQHPIVTPAMGGSYTLTVTKGKCSYTDAIQVEVKDKSVLDITNTPLDRTICSEDKIEIIFSSRYPGTTYKWKAVANTGDITGFSQNQNNQHDVLKLDEKLTNNGNASGTVTYTVTPIFYDGKKEIAGNSKDFVITVVPIAKQTIINTQKTSTNKPSFEWVPTLNPVVTGPVTYTWYANQSKSVKLHQGGTYTIPTLKPGTFHYFITTQQAGVPCESEPTKLELRVHQDITLLFDDATIKQGKSARLTANLSAGVVAPPEGITITLQHTKSSFGISPTIYIPGGSSSAFIDIVTTSTFTMDADETINFAGTKAGDYTIIGPASLTIKSDPHTRNLTLAFNGASVHGGEKATLTIHLPAGVKATNPITIAIKRNKDQSTAHVDKDYKYLQRSITIEAGANSKTIDAFTAKDNGVIDGSTKLVLTGTPSANYTIRDPNPSIIILDKTGDDPANRIITLTFQKPVVLGGDVNELTISLPKDIVSAKAITVTLGKDAAISTAKRGVDYESYPDLITIEAGKNYKILQLKTLGDDKVSKITTLAVNARVPARYQASASARVDIISGIHVPNVFTPGGTGEHPTWIITGMNLYPDCDVKVYNRWGGEVFTSHGYTEPWNGGLQNNLAKNQPVGTYYYVIEFNDSRGIRRVLKGYVAIIR